MQRYYLGWAQDAPQSTLITNIFVLLQEAIESTKKNGYGAPVRMRVERSIAVGLNPHFEQLNS
jgi:hypothetical protein